MCAWLPLGLIDGTTDDVPVPLRVAAELGERVPDAEAVTEGVARWLRDAVADPEPVLSWLRVKVGVRPPDTVCVGDAGGVAGWLGEAVAVGDAEELGVPLPLGLREPL